MVLVGAVVGVLVEVSVALVAAVAAEVVADYSDLRPKALRANPHILLRQEALVQVLAELEK